MKPKTKGAKLRQLKKEPSTNEASAPPLAAASAALPSAAKQRKQKQVQQAKLKTRPPLDLAAEAKADSEAVAKQLVAKLKKKIKKKQQGQQNSGPVKEDIAGKPHTPVQQSPGNKLSKKRKLSTEAGQKRPRLDANGTLKDDRISKGGATKQQPQQAAPPRPPTHREGPLVDTEPVRDPVLRARIADWLRRRTACTVRVHRLPNRLRLAQVRDLCPGVQACRMPWNSAAGRHKGVAFLEFASPEAAERARDKLNASKTLGVRLSASIRGPDDVNNGDEKAADRVADVDAYNCRRVVVSSLHPHTTGQELKDLVGDGSVLRVDFQHGSKLLRKNAPAAAFLTFADERRALDAVEKFQGHVIRGRATSWLLQRRTERSEHTRHPTQLVVFGVSKRVTDEDLLKAFPNSQKLDVRQGSGMAIVTYASEADCRADFEACKGGVRRVGKAKLRVQYGYALHGQTRQAVGSASSEQQQQQLSASQLKKAKRKQKLLEQQQQQRKPRPQKQPPTASSIDPSLFNKRQLVVKNFKPNTQEADFMGFLNGVRRVYFTTNRRLAFVHFDSEAAATEALARLAGAELFNGVKVKAMYAMDKPDKKRQPQQQQQEASQAPAAEQVHQQPDQLGDDPMLGNESNPPKQQQKKKTEKKRKLQQQQQSLKGKPPAAAKAKTPKKFASKVGKVGPTLTAA